MPRVQRPVNDLGAFRNENTQRGLYFRAQLPLSERGEGGDAGVIQRGNGNNVGHGHACSGSAALLPKGTIPVRSRATIMTGMRVS